MGRSKPKAAKAAKEANENEENFPTPKWAIRHFLRNSPELGSCGSKWLEPACGEGAIISVVDEHFSELEIRWTGIDVRTECLRPITELGASFLRRDFLEGDPAKPLAGLALDFDVAIGNPPFSLAMDFVKRALLHADRVVLLLRLGFVSSAKRGGWVANNVPDMDILADRPSFVGGGNDNSDYAWMTWRRGASHAVGNLRILPPVPKDERKKKE